MSDAVLGFLGGIVATLIASLTASIIQRQNHEKQRKEEASFEVYMRLLDINQHYFWIVSNEMCGKCPPNEIIEKIRKASWELADKLRTCDSVELLDELLTFLFSASIDTYAERSKLLEKIIDKYGAIVK